MLPLLYLFTVDPQKDPKKAVAKLSFHSNYGAKENDRLHILAPYKSECRRIRASTKFCRKKHDADELCHLEWVVHQWRPLNASLFYTFCPSSERPLVLWVIKSNRFSISTYQTCLYQDNICVNIIRLENNSRALRGSRIGCAVYVTGFRTDNERVSNIGVKLWQLHFYALNWNEYKKPDIVTPFLSISYCHLGERSS